MATDQHSTSVAPSSRHSPPRHCVSLKSDPIAERSASYMLSAMQEAAKLAAIAGLILNMAGVILLFCYGMPYRIETKGKGHILLEGTDENDVRIEARYRKLGATGLALILVGTALQVWGVIDA